MAPLIKELQKYPKDFSVKICVTAQHREMLDQVLDFFHILPDYDLDIMQKGQSLSQLTANILNHINPVFLDFQPDLVLVHGDTATTMSTSLAAFYLQIPVGHVEAGLRSFNKFSPFPEEVNRSITTLLSTYHFAPTPGAYQNLIRENIPEEMILITGNTVIDALMEGLDLLNGPKKNLIPESIQNALIPGARIILVTAHRRENLGDGFENMAEALLEISRMERVQIIIPMHLNPKVREVILRKLSGIDNVLLIEPQPYEVFLWLMNSSYIILTDSGGIQEEAPSLHKPVLVMRDTTERPEGMDAGVLRLVGTSREKIIHYTRDLLENEKSYLEMAGKKNPYGDGEASKKIVQYLKENL
jgi:UDP-N-acetylglucosamine 2-epimerase (non-hydrolysing)